MRPVWTTTWVWYTKNWLPFVCWWLVSKTHWITTKEEYSLENGMVVVTMQWQNQLFHGPTQKFKKTLIVADKICSHACIIWLQAPYALSGGSSLKFHPVMLHNSQDFSPSDMCTLKRAWAHNLPIWCHLKLLTALHATLTNVQGETREQ